LIDSKQLQEVEVLSLNGEPTRISQLWEDQTIVLSLIRHFG